MRQLINCFCTEAPYGLGDFLRGSIHLFERTKNYKNLEYEIDFSSHPIGEFIEEDRGMEKYNPNEVELITAKIRTLDIIESYDLIEKNLEEAIQNIKFRQKKKIFTNYHYLFKIPKKDIMINLNTETLGEDCKKWFKKRIKFNKKIEDRTLEVLDTFANKNFEVIHFRLGDEDSFYEKQGVFDGLWKPSYEDCWQECTEVIKKQKKRMPIIVMSDSNELKDFIEKKSEIMGLTIYTVHKKSNHTQEKPKKGCALKIKRNKNDSFYVALDMKILTMASKVHSFSVYFWGSGFVTWICKIFDVPIDILPLVDKERYLD
jgi:hypothetical protein